MRYVFRISSIAKEKMDQVASPQKHQRSAFIRYAIKVFLCKPKQALADRPHLRGQSAEYRQVCAILSQEQVSEIKAVYEEVSVSVVIQAAVVSALRKPRHKLEGFTLQEMRPADGAEQNTDADEDPNSDARKPKGTCSKS